MGSAGLGWSLACYGAIHFIATFDLNDRQSLPTANLTWSAPPNSGSNINSYFLVNGPTLHPAAAIQILKFSKIAAQLTPPGLKIWRWLWIRLNMFWRFSNTLFSFTCLYCEDVSLQSRCQAGLFFTHLKRENESNWQWLCGPTSWPFTAAVKIKALGNIQKKLGLLHSHVQILTPGGVSYSGSQEKVKFWIEATGCKIGPFTIK